MQNISEKFNAHGVRPTKQRCQLAELLFGDGMPRHFTADELFADAKRAGYQISLATIYNSLNVFCQSGMIREISVEGQRSFFDTNTDAHPHFLNVQTGEISDAPADRLTVHFDGAAPEGMQITGVDVVLRIAPKSQN